MKAHSFIIASLRPTSDGTTTGSSSFVHLDHIVYFHLKLSLQSESKHFASSALQSKNAVCAIIKHSRYFH